MQRTENYILNLVYIVENLKKSSDFPRFLTILIRINERKFIFKFQLSDDDEIQNATFVFSGAFANPVAVLGY